ncbi:MAG: hypothetical protein K0Q66_1874 [Chitinophagaceae bacterium]|nr:hypothetical protein [Chitinophagaceae bacterium]
MRILLFLSAFLCTVITGFAQESRGRVSVQVTNEQQQPLENATVELRRAKDSSIVKTAIADKNGWAEFDKVKQGSYLVVVNMVNYAAAYSAPVTVSATETDIKLPAIAMVAKAGNQLDNVTVSAKKPFIQKLVDRIVVNVDGSIISAGSTALDILERSPGVTIDQNDAISLRGRAGVIIMIDGKISPMTGADLANYLRGLPSNAIDRIEIITNPSAKYDASGNSGIIDIRMKKDQRIVTNVTATAVYVQGVYPKDNAGFTLS